MKAYLQLEKIFKKKAYFEHLSAIASWDEAVMMPSGGGEARAAALAALHAEMHSLTVDPKLADLFFKAKNESLDSPWQQVNLRLMEKMYRGSSAIPVELVERSQLAFRRCEQAWRHLRSQNDWPAFAPLLNENIVLTREIAFYRGEALGLNPYDSLLDLYTPEMTQAQLDPLFDDLLNVLPAMIQKAEALQSEPLRMQGPFPISTQRELGLQVMAVMGFDFNHGRLDVSHHPFCGGVPEDVRITTRYHEDNFISALMGICHETGHALYELGLPRDWLLQPVGEPIRYTVHESQSLFMEMQICRSREFCEYLAPLLKQFFGDNEAFNALNVYRTVTRVSPGLIRVDADELSYPLHIILRYQLEKQLIAGTMNVNELPDYWHHFMHQHFSLSTLGNDKDGVMQDVHWPSGSFGYFPAYTVGAMMAAQFFQTAVHAMPTVMDDIRQGVFQNLVKWLKDNIHSQGSLYLPDELMRRVTGKSLSAEAFLMHLNKRYL